MMWAYDDRWRMHDDSRSAWVMVFLMLVLVVAIVVALVAVLRGTTSLTPRTTGGGAGAVPDARGILRDRFARGDIDEEDFRARMRALDDTGG